MIKFLYADEFIKDFNKLKKTYHSLWWCEEWEWDFADLKKVLQQYPKWVWGIERIDQLWKDIVIPVYKVKKFACRSLSSTSKLRIIYAYDNENEELHFIQFIEIYAKADKENMKDRAIRMTGARWEKAYKSKLKENQVKEIQVSNLSITELAKLYNVNQSTISKIKKWKSWRHLLENNLLPTTTNEA